MEGKFIYFVSHSTLTRLQYMALSSQICTKRLKEALQGKSGELLRTDEVRINSLYLK